MGFTNKRRIFIPKNTNNVVIWSGFIFNGKNRATEEMAFRINLGNGQNFKSIQWKTDGRPWTDFAPVRISANLYIVIIPADGRFNLSLRMSSGDEDITIRYINIQPGSSLGVFPPTRDPNQIPGLYTHYSASDLVLNGTNVAQLNDRTDNNNHIKQATAADQPSYTASDADFNNQPSITFDGTSDFLETDTFSEMVRQPTTVVLVFKNTATNPGPYFGTTDSFATNQSFAANTNNYVATADRSSLNVGTVDSNTTIALLRYNLNNTSLYINGGDNVAKGTLGNSIIQNLYLGRSFDSNSFGNFKLAEFFLYDRFITDNETDLVGNMLGDRYGVTWSTVERDPNLRERTFTFSMDISTFIKPTERTQDFTSDMIVMTATTPPTLRTKEITSDVIIAETPSVMRTQTFTADMVIPSSAIDPGTVPGLYIRYGADDVETTPESGNTLVSSFNDKIASRDATQSVNGFRPRFRSADSDFNGKPSVAFVGDYLRTAAFPEQAQPNTIVMVYNRVGNFTGNTFLYAGIARNNRHRLGTKRKDNTFNSEFTVNGGMTQEGATVDNETHISAIRFNTTATTAYIDGGTSFIAATPNTGNERVIGFTLGANWHAGSPRGPSSVKIAEFFMWNRLLTNAELNTVGNSLAQTYNLTWTDIT